MSAGNPANDAGSLLARNGELVEHFLSGFVATLDGAPPRLLEAINYSLLAGGKRLRPTLVLESHTACAARGTSAGPLAPGASPLAPTATALAAAGAIEMIHTFSLVHDDLPAMDDDDLRRGRPTNHKVFGEAMAILAGDAMVTLAFELIARRADADLAPRLIAELASASGPVGMIGGQVLDMTGENQSLSLQQLQQIHRMKTGALLTTSCRLGAIAARATDERLDALTMFGQHLGLAFQIVDDVLDVISTPQQLGKATNKDAGRGKNTYPALMGLDESRAEASRQIDRALAALNAFDSAAEGLRTLAKFVVARQS